MDGRDVYVEQLRAQLKQWNAEVAEAEQAELHARPGHAESVELMREQRDRMRVHLHGFEQASDESWDVVRRTFDLAWEEICTRFEQARERFRR